MATFVSKHLANTGSIAGIKSFACDQCGKTFGTNGDLRRHVDAVHKGVLD